MKLGRIYPGLLFFTPHNQSSHGDEGEVFLRKIEVRYQKYGKLVQSISRRTSEFPFSLEGNRLKRYYHFITEKGLLALSWLEGFPLTLEPRFRGEVTRLARIRGEIEEGGRRLVAVTGIQPGMTDPGNLFWDCMKRTKVEVP